MTTVTLDDLSRSFARRLRAEGKAPRTVDLYGQSVRIYSEWLERQGTPATVEHFTRDNVIDWLAYLNTRYAAGTVRTRHRGLMRFARWAVGEEELPANPMAGIPAPPPDDKPVAVLSDDDLAAMVRACKGKTFNDRRDEAIVRFLLDTGARVGELIALRVEDVRLDDGYAIVTGKTGTRPVYFGTRTVAALDRYERARRGSRWAHLDAYWLSARGALSGDGARDLIARRSVLAGLDRVHPHQFRHTFAHDHLLHGGQERDLKRLAGWSSDVMLERYGASAADSRARTARQAMRRGDRV